MNLTINAVNFEMAEKLEKFIEKKMARFERHLNPDDKVEIRMSVISDPVSTPRCFFSCK